MDTQKIQELKKLISGSVVGPGDKLYEKASKMFTRTIAPSVVVRPESNEDVAAIIRFVKQYNIPFAIRSGGHNSIANRLADGILLIEMSGLAFIEVIEPSEGLVRVGAGALWSEVASELEKHGLGISSGDTGSVGVGGLATGAGLGWMVRKYGPLVDNTVAAEVVMADGSIVKASQSKNSDLFWAIRGGGSNFGVVTNFTFRAHAVAGVFIGTVSYPMQNVGKIIKGWRDAMREAPRELTTMLTTLPSFGGEAPTIMIRGCIDGTDEALAGETFAPFLTLGEPVSHEISAHPYKDVLEKAMYPPNIRVIGNTTFVQELTDEAIDMIDKLCRNTPPLLQIRHVAGAMNERAADVTAFSHRDSEVLIVSPTFVSPTASSEDIKTALAPWRAIEPFGQGPYLNLISEDTGKEVTQAYLPSTLQRLRKIKARYDPDNIFHTNYNITPAS